MKEGYTFIDFLCGKTKEERLYSWLYCLLIVPFSLIVLFIFKLIFMLLS